MERKEGVEDILRLAIDMQNSYQGFSVQDIPTLVPSFVQYST